MTEVDPAAAGMDEARLERITDHFARAYLDPGKIAGCQVLVSRHGRPAYARTFGTLVAGGDRPVTHDTVWRIYSMTKPITAVALALLPRDGRVRSSRRGDRRPAVRRLPPGARLRPAEHGRRDFFWGGAASTIFWVDPVQDLFVIFTVQITPSGTFDFRGQLKSLVYSAIVE